ncbi:MAG: TetR/AcrR family transcriptional regulator [Lachnospiraceae bacterium]|nr:TetR/AcrR family transcriptional regulator [Lachnospiraceae bacterium]
MSSKWDNNKNQKRTALLENAFDLFITKGINKTSISDIVEKAGVAKGTFYLYFKDKDDIRNRLILHKINHIFSEAEKALAKTTLTDFTERIIFITGFILDCLQEDTSILALTAKNLNWGSFKRVVKSDKNDELNLYDLYVSQFENGRQKYKNTEILVYMIIEFITSTCYSSILYGEPASLTELKPYLYDTIRAMMKTQEL